MRIGLNLLYLIPNVVGGTQTYAVSLIRSLARIDHDNEYFVFLNQESKSLELVEASNFNRIVCKFLAGRRATRYLWEQVVFPFQLRDYHLDLVHSLGYVGPLVTSCPSIVTIPDLNYIALRNFIPAGRRRLLQFFSTQAARRSTHVITISHFSKAAIVQHLNLSPDRITVTQLGPGWMEDGDAACCDELKLGAYHLPEHYIVAFGGSSPHKNISRLTSAFQTIKHDYPHSLVLLGHLPADVDLKALGSDAESSGRIMILGYIPREHIRPILGGADLFVLPSLYEGFGMPLLEAQTSLTPVACASSGSLPEIAGDSVVFFDPFSADDIGRAIRQCLGDADLRASLRRRGVQNVRRFSWENTARETLEVYRRTYFQVTSARNL